MSAPFAVAISAAALIASFAGLAAKAPPAPAGDTLPAVQFVGHDSRVATPRFVLVRDEKAWALLWSEHTGIDASFTPPTRHAVPKIDFTRYMVVGVFAGATTNTDGELAQTVLVDGDGVRVRYMASTFQTARFDGKADEGVKTTPFGIWVIEKTDKAVVIEEGSSGLKDAPVVWKEVKRFDVK